MKTFLLALVVSFLASATIAEESPGFTGKVERIETDGIGVLKDGTRFFFRGLEIDDTPAVQRLLAGEDIRCWVIHQQGPVPSADCLFLLIEVDPSQLEEQDMAWLFQLLPETGLAHRRCFERDLGTNPRFTGVGNSCVPELGYDYLCSASLGSFRGRPGPPPSLY